MKRQLSLLAVAGILFGLATCTSEEPVAPEHQNVIPAPQPNVASGLLLAPIEGVTTQWHPAPKSFSVPRGTVIRLRCMAGSNARVIWNGAEESSRDANGSTALCVVDDGVHVVEANIEIEEGGGTGNKAKPGSSSSMSSYTCRITSVEARFDEMSVERTEVTRSRELPDDAHLTNWQGVREVKRGSVAGVTNPRPDQFVTAVGTTVQVSALCRPAELGELVEWRVDGQAALLGVAGALNVGDEPGQHTIEIGPLSRSRTLHLTTYAVTIEPERGSFTQIPDGRPVTFHATTDPPGYESQVTWLAGTLYGSVTPVTGSGPSLTAQFDGTVTSGEPPRWIGVRADNALFFSDCCAPPPTSNCACLSIAWTTLSVMPACPPTGTVPRNFIVEMSLNNSGPPETIICQFYDYDGNEFPYVTPPDLLDQIEETCPTGLSTVTCRLAAWCDGDCFVRGVGGTSGGAPEVEGRTAEVYAYVTAGGAFLCQSAIMNITCP